MQTKHKLTSVLLVSTNLSINEAARAALDSEDSLTLIEKEITLENLYLIVAETQPNVILFDFENLHHPFYQLYRIASEFPMYPVIAILSASKMGKSHRVVQAGAWDTIEAPFTPYKLVSTIKDVAEKFKGEQVVPLPPPVADPNINPEIPNITGNNNPDNHPNNTFTVFSPKGGAGCTTIATNLAISLHETLKEDVLLIDGKLLFGHVALYLNLVTGNAITDLIPHADMLDEQLIKQVVVKHKSGIHVLPCPNSIADSQGITPENLFKVVQGLQNVYPNIIIDGGNNINENTVTYLDSSNKILLVLNPDLASMRDVRQFMTISENLSYPADKILFLLNLSGRKTDVKKEEIENILKMKVFGRIPVDEELALNCLNEGVPILQKKPHHPISKAYSEITAELIKIIHQSRIE